MQTQPHTNNLKRTLLIGLYIGALTSALAFPIAWVLGYLARFVAYPYPLVTFAGTMIAAFVAYWLEEAIRTSQYPRRTKIMLAGLVLAVIIPISAGLWFYSMNSMMQSLNQA